MAILHTQKENNDSSNYSFFFYSLSTSEAHPAGAKAYCEKGFDAYTFSS